MTKKLSELRKKFLQIAMEEIVFYGFNNEMLTSVEKKMNLQNNYHIILFPGGIKDIICNVEEEFNSNMQKAFQEIHGDNIFNIRVRDKIKHLVMLRLKGPNKHTQKVFSKLVNFYSKPQNITFSLKNTWSIADKIWYLAGDKSTDFNHYTKRSLLFPIYKSTLLYYISDKSDNFMDTEIFLEKKISQVMQIHKIKNIVPNTLERLKNNIPFIRLIKKK